MHFLEVSVVFAYLRNVLQRLFFYRIILATFIIKSTFIVLSGSNEWLTC